MAWRGDAEVARIAKASDEVSRGGLTLGGGEFEEGRHPRSARWKPWFGVADVRGSQRFSFSAQWLKPPRGPWGDECRADCGRGERKALALISLQGLGLTRDSGLRRIFVGSLDFRCRALPRRRGQLWQPLQGDVLAHRTPGNELRLPLSVFFGTVCHWPRKPFTLVKEGLEVATLPGRIWRILHLTFVQWDAPAQPASPDP